MELAATGTAGRIQPGFKPGKELDQRPGDIRIQPGKGTVRHFFHTLGREHVIDTTRQLEAAVSVTRRINVTAASQREKAGIELHIVSGARIDGKDTVPVSESKFLPVFTTAHVDGHPVKPPFGIGRFSNLLQPLMAIGAFIVYGK